MRLLTRSPGLHTPPAAATLGNDPDSSHYLDPTVVGTQAIALPMPRAEC
jgi:hypothetical protein